MFGVQVEQQIPVPVDSSEDKEEVRNTYGLGRSIYRTAWSVPPMYGHGPAIGPHTGRQTYRMLSSVWRVLAPLMSPWCAEGSVPTLANLNL